MFFKFLPQEFNFFKLFEKQADCAVEAAIYLKKTVSSGSAGEEALGKMRDLEHEGDEASHAIIDQLNKSFITPFDREDIHTLTKELDDITDMINTLLNHIVVYRLCGVNANLVEFACVIENSVQAVACAVKGLRNTKNLAHVSEHCVEVNRLENLGDSMRNRMLGELFEKEKDPITLIKLKEIYQDAETILDICEDVAHVVESILVKQA